MRFASHNEPTLVFIGPSGTGKSTIAYWLVEQDIVELNPTYTTRPMREGDERDKTHIFVSEDKFDQLETRGKFLNTEHMFGLPYRYGFARIVEPRPGKVPLVMLRAELIQYLPAFYKNFKVYQIESNRQTAINRLIQREPHLKNQGNRISNYDKELAEGRKLADRIFVNDDLLSVCHEIKLAIKKDFSKI